ncbi:MAG: VCBS repeat-containing protein [Leadbetterella sp.]
MKFNKYYLLIPVAICSCKLSNEKQLFEKIDSSESGIKFINKVEDQEKFNILTYRNFYNGGGVAIGDINNDGLKDVFFTSNQGQNKLYLNKGNLQFEDISDKAGITGKKAWHTGVTMSDVNQDGFMDIYVCNSGEISKENRENELYINKGNLKFTEEAAKYGLNDKGMSTHASFFDYDLDGDLDCYVLNNSYLDPERISTYRQERGNYDLEGGDRLYKNENGKFIDATKESKIYSSNIGFGLGISVGDINNDLYPDIYISNDFFERDYLYINQKDGSFKESLPDQINYTSLSSMGSDIADVNNDGSLDIFTTDMLPPDNYRLKAATKFDDYYHEDLKFKNSYHHQFVQNCLQVNQGDGQFTETAFYSGIAATDWSWGALMFDSNLDGYKDVFVSNGVFHDITDSDFVDFIGDKDEIKKIVQEKGRYDFRDFIPFLPANKRKNYLFINQKDLTFKNQADLAGMEEGSFSNGSAYGDLDNDGDYDLVVNNVNMESFIYKNNATENKNNYLKIKLIGKQGNQNGIGAKLILQSDSMTQHCTSMAARGFQSSVDTDVIFAIPNTASKYTLSVIWPDGSMQNLAISKFSNTISLYQKDASDTFSTPSSSNVDFDCVDTKIVHSENLYSDYDFERLVPHMFSTMTPRIIVGDINNDKLEDFVLTGSFSQKNRSYVQNKNGGLTEIKQPDFENDSAFEANSGLLFDIDGDKDLDLLLGAGGNEPNRKRESYYLRVFENNGKGVFKKSSLKGVTVEGQISCIEPSDMDHDGDLDLFLGGRSIPGLYGLVPRSYLLLNEGQGNWQDITTEATGPIGMIMDATWADFDSDGWEDLIVVGEYMPVTLFLNKNGLLQGPNTLKDSEGWWTSITKADIDLDGDADFVLGNWGLNQKLKASLSNPIQLYTSNFDGTERPISLLEWYAPEESKPYLFASRNDLFAKIPALKKKALKYQKYATMSINDLFAKDIMQKSQIKSVKTFESCVLWNNNGDLQLKPLPKEAQMSAVFASLVKDVDGDQLPDLILGGNFFSLKPEMGRIEGFNGGYFKGNGKGGFSFKNAKNTGINIRGEVRDIQSVGTNILFTRNNNSVISLRRK